MNELKDADVEPMNKAQSTYEDISNPSRKREDKINYKEAL